MRKPTLQAPARSSAFARVRVDALLQWAEHDLDLLSRAFGGCTPDEVTELCRREGVPSLPASYERFVCRMGAGGPGSFLAELFPGDDLALGPHPPVIDQAARRDTAEAILRDRGYRLSWGDDHLVIRLRGGGAVDFVHIGSPDPAVGTFSVAAAPELLFPCFTGWLEHAIGRAIKRRYPLREARFAGLAVEADPVDPDPADSTGSPPVASAAAGAGEAIGLPKRERGADQAG
jgi:hypothetical protein